MVVKPVRNWFTSISASVLASHESEPLYFSGSAPELSCFFTFMYRQKGLGLLFERPSSIVFLSVSILLCERLVACLYKRFFLLK